MKKFKFIDLFAGIGGFHQALSQLNGQCVFASEIDKFAINTYMENYKLDADNDITKVNINNIPKYDVLCAGFPCQAFSKAGKRMGFADKTKGTLFFEIAKILEKTKPKFIILENVRNLISHDNGNTIKIIKEVLDELNYNIKVVIMSPHQIGIPQLRERVYILGVRKEIYNELLNIEIPKVNKSLINNYDFNILDSSFVNDDYKISKHEEMVLNCWDEFYNGIKEKVLGFPIWVSEFTSNSSLDNLPKWKANFCLKNRNLYLNNKTFIDKWLKKWNYLQNFNNTEKKFEWQAGEHITSLWDGFIQFRPSGIRVKRPNLFPTLVAMVQIPIIGKYKRYLSPREVARLQSFPDSFIPNANKYQAYKQFGNAVNVKCIKFLAEQLLKYDKKE
ncbi:DNA cytosine methyltransferase [Mycoplasmopsis gallinarum]|uniref:Cytosine-specific methyltransferase n=1 Tax=Mycoplasmopsis gallinarum TaxID=29557 RepID=A0A168RPD1_9BACT|nr:DNA cytosine methyltransferase [Mycoplasmopsis gallinarum]OAB49165.1 DNA-cytosine methyltransferase [Mycoplasmopsis gallinarum]